VLNRAARVQGTAYGGQVLAEGLAVDKVAQEWRMLYQQKPTGRSSRSVRCMPGMFVDTTMLPTIVPCT
jgi:class 3 adenylate cyclase